MSVGSLLRSSYLCYFSHPAHDRAVYKAVKSRQVRSIVEVGIGLGGRTERLLEIASWRADCLPLRYTGIDLFEARPQSGAGVPAALSLKQAFRQLRLPSVQVQLVPGPPDAALMRVANSLTGTDLLLISADHDDAALARTWPWVPRMLSPQSLVFLEERPAAGGQALCWRLLTPGDIHRLAGTTRHRRAA